ncbi:hypothetical protein [Coleofasciculus sp. FACHB-SPT36]|uniref:hypothetical protein n=1 Tax=Cyanophyceae TaxID=3028117 RepID=UPI00168AFFB8|nr:hypothetical protein [Coleofasciculus sp. FACHB-SPT36]MBD2539367.1 hypothetical protein [Coleofasciculus sp. FACHB-SPT36]
MTQIAEQSPNKLVLRQNYVSFGRVFREILVTGIGVGFLLWTGPAKLNCQRIELTQVTCQLSKPGWLGLGVWQNTPIRNLQAVELTTNVDDGVFYQVLLQTSEGEVPLREYKTSGLDNTQESVDRINTFLKDPTANRLSIAQVDWLQWSGLLPCMFFLVGINALYVSLLSIRSKLIESYCIDQTQNRLTYQYGSLWRQRQEHYDFSDIHRVILDVDPWAKVRLFVEMRSGELLCLCGQAHPSVKSPWEGAEWQQVQPIADEVSRRVYCPWQLALGFGQTWIDKYVAPNPYAKVTAQWLKANVQSSKVWVFDRSGHCIISQDSNTVKTYTLRDFVDVQVQLTPSRRLVPKEDGDGDKFYDVNYQIVLVLTSKRQVAIQYYSSREYNWEPESGKQATAQVRAEETAQRIRQYVRKD